MPSHSPEDIAAEFYIDGEYRSEYANIDLSDRIRGNDRIRITHGLVDQQSAVSPSSAGFTLNNGDGLFTNENPDSPLYGKVPLQLRGRIGVKDSDGTWGEYLRLPDWNEGQTLEYAYTADKASLDITGDIDIRIECAPYYTRPHAPMTMMAKYLTSGNQRSWLLSFRPNGTVTFVHATDGTFATLAEVNSGVQAVAENGHKFAFRMTLDVDNGSGGKTYRFYAADSIAGPWTEVSNLTTAGTTSIFSSSQELEIGSGNDGGGVFSGYTPFRGKVYAAEVYSGIDGTLVADFKPAGKGPETREWVDGCASPNTWIIQGDYARLASDRIRVSGELSSIPESWDVTGRDRWIPTTMSGILARYQSNKAPLGSAIYRNYRNYEGLTGYWRMEDEPGAVRAGSSVPGSPAGTLVSCSFGSPTGLPGSTGALTLTSGPNVSKAVLIPKIVANTGVATSLFYFRLDSLPSSDQALVTLQTSGTTSRWTISVSGTGFLFSGYNSVGTLIDSGSVLFGALASPLDQWIGMVLTLTQESGNVRWETSWHAVGTDTFYTHNVGGDTYAGTMAPWRRVTLETSDSAFAGAQFAHVITAVSSLDLVSNRFKEASNAYSGETFGRRLLRLAEEENVFVEWLGDPDETEVVGPQAADTLFNIFAQGAAVDGGILSDVRDRPGYYYVSARALGVRRGPALDYSESHLADTPQAINDNRYTVNDFTATRPSGSTARYEATDDRKKNVRDPDDTDSPGIGRWERSGAFNVAEDSQLPGQAERQVAVGTWPERRIPNLAIGLHREQIFGDSVLFSDILSIGVGDPVSLTGLASAPMPPDDRHLLTYGYSEVIHNFLWDLSLNTVPQGSIWLDTFDSEEHEPRLDATTTEIHCNQEGVFAGATSIRIRTPQERSDGGVEPAWINSTDHASEFPVDIVVGGERMTLTACTASDGNAELVAGHFEDADFTDYWFANGGTVEQSSTFAQAGTYSALLTVSGSPSQAYIYPDTVTAAPRVDAGDSITASGWVRVAVDQSDVRMVIDYLDENGGYMSSSDSGAAALAAASGWVQRSVTATVPAGAYYVHYHPMILGSPANGTLLYMDNLAITNNSKNYQTMTVTRSVNGISKSHADGDRPRLFQPTYLGFGEGY